VGSKYRVHLCIAVVAFLLQRDPKKVFRFQKLSLFDFNFFIYCQHGWRCHGLRGLKAALIFRRETIICYRNSFILVKDEGWMSI